MPNYKYKIIWEHDGVTDEMYALTDSDVEQIKKAIDLAVSRGAYKDSNIKVKEINIQE